MKEAEATEWVSDSAKVVEIVALLLRMALLEAPSHRQDVLSGASRNRAVNPAMLTAMLRISGNPKSGLWHRWKSHEAYCDCFLREVVNLSRHDIHLPLCGYESS